MLTLGEQKTDALTLGFLVAVAAAAAVLSVAVPVLLPWSFLALGGAALLLYWGVRWDVTVWAWLWVLSYGLLDWPQWRIEVTGFFNLTVPRLIFLAGVVAFAVHFAVRRRPRVDTAVGWSMAILAVICALSMAATGWVARTPQVLTAPYYRFLGSVLMPLVMFFLVYGAADRSEQIPRFLVPLTIYGWYAIGIGYLQYAAVMGLGGARDLIWPAYINDPTFGIHFDRARGAFGAAGPQSMLLVFLFYADLYLLRRLRGPYRAALILQAVLTVPAIFFTGLRSAYVGFAVCGVLWCLAAGRGRLGGVKLALAGLVVLLGAVMFWGNLAQPVRRTGGVAQVSPVVARWFLLAQTWRLFRQHPLVGVGFGHFVDAQQELASEAVLPGELTGGVMVEHNLFLNMMAETGIVGLAATVAIFVLIGRQAMRLHRRLADRAPRWLDRDFVVLFLIALLNHLTASMFRDMLWDVFANGLLFSFAALVAGLERASRARLPQPPGSAAPAAGE